MLTGLKKAVGRPVPAGFDDDDLDAVDTTDADVRFSNGELLQLPTGSSSNHQRPQRHQQQHPQEQHHQECEISKPALAVEFILTASAHIAA